MSRVISPCYARSRSFCFTNQLLLFLCRLDQQRGEPAVIDALGILAVLLPTNNLRNDGTDLLSNHTHFVFSVCLQVVRDTPELFDSTIMIGSR